MRLILHACSAFLINSNDDQAHSFPDTSSHTPTTKKKRSHLLHFVSLFLHCCCLLYCSLHPHYISYLPPSACHLCLNLTPLKAQKSAQDRSSERLPGNIMAFMSVTHTVSSWMYLVDLWIVVLRDASHSTCQCMNTAWQSEWKPGFWESLFVQVVR